MGNINLVVLVSWGHTLSRDNAAGLGAPAAWRSQKLTELREGGFK